MADTKAVSRGGSSGFQALLTADGADLFLDFIPCRFVYAG